MNRRLRRPGPARPAFPWFSAGLAVVLGTTVVVARGRVQARPTDAPALEAPAGPRVHAPVPSEELLEESLEEAFLPAAAGTPTALVAPRPGTGVAGGAEPRSEPAAVAGE